MSLDQARELLAQLKSAFEGGNMEAAEGHFADIKPVVARFEHTPPFFNLNARNAKEENELAREAYELGLFVAIELDDKEAFDQTVSLLLPLYTDVRGLSESEHRGLVLGLFLLGLLVDGASDEFHAMVESLRLEDRQNPSVTFVLSMDEDLAIGQYNKVLSAILDPPHGSFAFFTDRMLPSIRETIAECVEVAYKVLSLEGAMELLMFEDREECLDFVREEMEWEVAEGEEDGVQRILLEEGMKRKGALGGGERDIPSMNVIEQNLSYATEMERIV
jgi:26S proteasome regulatory subunit N12